MGGQDTLEVAEDLYRRATAEAEYRTVASRAYMSVFQHLRDHPKIGFSSNGTGEDHRDLIKFLKNSTSPDLQKLGIRYLIPLRTMRNRADYAMEPPLTKELAEDALECATEVVYSLCP